MPISVHTFPRGLVQFINYCKFLRISTIKTDCNIVLNQYNQDFWQEREGLYTSLNLKEIDLSTTKESDGTRRISKLSYYLQCVFTINDNS